MTVGRAIDEAIKINEQLYPGSKVYTVEAQATPWPVSGVFRVSLRGDWGYSAMVYHIDPKEFQK
jgi:hypothetical protein